MKEVLKLLKEIKEDIAHSKRSYTTKIQSMGKNKAGSYRYMIYVTKAVEELGLIKGDEISFTLTKTDKITPNIEETNTDKPNVEYVKKDGVTEVKLEGNPKPIDLNPFETWKAKYEEYKEKDDNRLGSHIIMGKQGELKDKIIEHLK